MSVTEEASAAANTSDAAPGDTPAAKGDEQGVSLTGTPELADPAILAVNPKFRYGKEELLKLRDAPLSQRKPDFLDINEVSPTIWDPTRWNDRKKSDTPTENGSRTSDEHRRRPGDPRERLRKENDGIVLSPQRRSFNSGCCVPGRAAAPNRPHSPIGGGKNDLGGGGGGVREIQPSSRRIGSGRILRDTWDFGEKPEGGDNDYGFRSQARGGGGDGPERRSFGRDFDRDKDKERRRFGDRRRIGGGDSRDEEPEWFSGGPSSQNDTIELRGFDDSERLGKKKAAPGQPKRGRDWFKKKAEVASVTEEKEDLSIEGGPDARSTPTSQAGEAEAKDGGGGEQNGGAATGKAEQDGDAKQNNQQEKSLNDQSYIFEDILKSDSIPGLPGLLTNGVGGDGDTNGKSRFSKWFSLESNQSESRRSSVQDEAIIKNLLKDLNEPSVSIPGDSNSYFAPISPAANTGTGMGGGTAAANAKSINIMEMLQRGKQNDAGLKSQIPGRILNLNEIEAKMRQSAEPMHKHPQKTEEDMSAFNRLLANMSGAAATANGPLPKTQPMSLMEMLSHSQQLDEAHARMTQLLGPASPGASPHDLATRLQQVQSQQQKQQQVEMLTKLMNAGMQVRASPLPEMGLQQSRELLSRPEAQAILQGLKIGDITPQHLYQQLANPALQPRHREMLVTILKLQGGGGGGGGVGPSPRVLSPVAPHPMFQQQQQQQQLRVSPLPPNALHQRIPSPRELQVHTQNILQRALIKKKLEEQQENYRKKQEMQQRGQSPNNNNTTTNNNNTGGQQPTKSVSSPTPLAFTPTSVLRKMTAEKDEGGKDVTKLVEGAKLTQGRAVTGMRSQTQQQQPPTAAVAAAATQQQWNPYQQMNMKQAGRPIVKANSFQPQQQQELLFNQQQQQKFLSQLQQQQRKTAAAPFHGHGSMPGHHPQYANPNSQQFSQLTQQQLRAQHQQHARPSQQQQGQQGQQYGSQQGNGSWQQYLNPQQNRGQVGRGGVSDGDMSPTSNQLTRWFSPDLLERARVGELPSTAGLSQHLLSLEEIERLTAPPVHN